MSKVIVIGGGAAGMMAAIWAAREKADVILLEKNEKLGKKLFITGKGRCNLTNACDVETLFPNVVTNAKFLYSAFYSFQSSQVMDFFESLGMPVKIERGKRVFPKSDHSSDVIRALEMECRRLGVCICLHTAVKKILYHLDKEQLSSGKQKANGAVKHIDGVMLLDGTCMHADKVIVACGGISYPRTGACPDGYIFAADCGHEIKQCYPSLVPFNVKEQWTHELMGLSLKNVSVRLVQGKKKIYEGFGEMLFTHFGVSGPLIISASAYIHKYLGQTATLFIDLKPALDEKQLDERILRDFEQNKNKQFCHAIDSLLPKKMIPVIIRESGIDEHKKVHEITRQERTRLVHMIKTLPLTNTGIRGYDEAIITKGGVSVTQVNPSTMESRLVSGLYFAGEVLDVDALTGGFNLQIAWSTGYLAGISCAKDEG